MELLWFKLIDLFKLCRERPLQDVHTTAHSFSLAYVTNDSINGLYAVLGHRQAKLSDLVSKD
jgi:hypothetical protein